MMNTKGSRRDESLKKPFFFSPKIRFNKIRNFSLNKINDESGFTLVELIVVVMMIGILSSIAVPQFMTAADKAKQKEATGIVAAFIKAATAYQTEYGGLPENAEAIEEYAKFQKCNADDAGPVGGPACKGTTPVPLEADDDDFISSSGHYRIQFRREPDEPGEGQQFQVLANPNGGAYASNGSAVTGCYNPTLSLSEIYEYTAKADDKGQKGYKGCPDEAPAEE